MNKPLTIVMSLMSVMQTAGAEQGEAAARLVESPLNAENLTTTAVGLIFVLGLMLGLAWLVKRFIQVPGLSKGSVRVVGGVSLGARERAVLLAVDQRRILVGIAPGQVRTLVDLGEVAPGDDIAAAATDQNANFAQQIGRLIKRDGDNRTGAQS